MKINIIELIEKNNMKASEYTVSIIGHCYGRVEHRFYYYHIGCDTVDFMVNSMLEEISIERDANEDDYCMTSEIRIDNEHKAILITCTPKYIYIKHRNGKVNRRVYDRVKKMA